MLTLEQARSRVARGAALLDSEQPHWFTRIDMHDLVLWSCERCVLGQLYGDYHIGLKAFRIFMTSNPIAHGFIVISEDGSELSDWTTLRIAWIETINDRLAVHAAAAADANAELVLA